MVLLCHVLLLAGAGCPPGVSAGLELSGPSFSKKLGGREGWREGRKVGGSCDVVCAYAILH